MSNLGDRRKKVFAPSLDTFGGWKDEPVTLVSGDGAWVVDDAGRKYLDCSSQNMTVSIGFNHPRTIARVSEQLHRIQHTTSIYMNETSIAYAEELVRRFPHPDEWVVHLVNTGSEAIDLAIMMARAHTGRLDLMTLRNGYHGLHSGANETTSFSVLRQPRSTAAYVHPVHEPNPYRGVFGPDHSAYVEEFRRSIFSLTPGEIAGSLVEPIQGFAGTVPFPVGYVRDIFDATREAGGVAICDEVQTGFGRTGRSFFGFEFHDATPDIVVVAKGMGNGFPIAGVVARREIAESFARRPFFNTYATNPICAAAAHSVLEVIDSDGLIHNAAVRGEQLREGLLALYERHPIIGDVRGMGLMQAMEVVSSRDSKVPATEQAITIGEVLREEGVLCIRGGVTRNVFRFNPTLGVTQSDISHLLGALETALVAVEQ